MPDGRLNSSLPAVSLRRFMGAPREIELCHYRADPSIMAEFMPKDRLGSRSTNLDYVPELGQPTCR